MLYLLLLSVAGLEVVNWKEASLLSQPDFHPLKARLRQPDTHTGLMKLNLQQMLFQTATPPSVTHSLTPLVLAARKRGRGVSASVLFKMSAVLLSIAMETIPWQFHL